MINNVELVSDIHQSDSVIHQSDSVIHIHVSVAAMKLKDTCSLKEKL